MTEGIKLVAMRLKDMGTMHPEQDNSHVCSQCGETVGVYPSGQRALHNFPELAIICHVCASGVTGAKAFPAAPWDEIKREAHESRRRS
jgi:hypothetical protein